MPYGCTVARVAPGADGGGHALRWTVGDGQESAALYLEGVPADFRRFGALRFRARYEGARPGRLLVRIEGADRAFLEASVAGVGASWKRFEVIPAEMRRTPTFDPEKVARISFVVFGPRPGAFEIDRVEAAAEPEVGKVEGKASGPVRTVADFEEEGSADYLEAARSAAERIPEPGSKRNHCAAWSVATGDSRPQLFLLGVPADLRPYRTLRFRVRSDAVVDQPVFVRLENSVDRFLGGRIEGIGKSWSEVELPLPAMREEGRFDPARVQAVTLTLFRPTAARILLDDVALERAEGGWRYTEREMVAHLFGEERVRKVRRVPTEHFEIHTDSRAALSKFPAALEKTYDFVRDSLGTGEIGEKLPVYIFQNSDLYFDFCERTLGWSREAASRTGGHGSGRYFATYYQAPEAPVVTHELTHSIFHRTVGSGGGSWFQEGVAVFVEKRWERKGAAAEFAPRLRSGQFLPLARFLRLPRLVDEEGVRGGAETAGALYDQAGAFFEFLLRGPPAARWKGAMASLAASDAEDDEIPALLADLLGTDLPALEKAWVAWGSHPPAR